MTSLQYEQLKTIQSSGRMQNFIFLIYFHKHGWIAHIALTPVGRTEILKPVRLNKVDFIFSGKYYFSNVLISMLVLFNTKFHVHLPNIPLSLNYHKSVPKQEFTSYF
jgi:hypothetical protein